jgi:sulfatase maturation enzyme AslB (radical SAM superfamily)
LPYLTEDYYLNFYGGKPLLSFELIKQVVSFLETQNTHHDKKVRYSLATNGSLLSDEIIQFLDEHEFSVELSFDGLAQDAGRKKGSAKKLVPITRKLLNQPNIDLEINSVFSPATVNLLSESIRFVLEFGVSDISCSISTTEPWSQASLEKLESELAELRKTLVPHVQRYGHIPVINFRDTVGKGIFYCAAGQDRLAIDPNGGV